MNDAGIRIAVLCLSLSSGGLEYHTVDIANLLAESGTKTVLILSEKSAVKRRISSPMLEFIEIKKPKKYYDLLRAFKLLFFLKKSKITSLICADNNDLNFASLLKSLSGKRIKLIYIQQMQIGINKKDFFHNITHSKVDVWITPLEYLKGQVLKRTNVREDKVRVIRYGSDLLKLKNIKDKKRAREILKLPYDCFLLGILARIDRLKGQEFLVEFMKLFKNNSGFNIGLVISGEVTKNENGKFAEILIEKVINYNLQKKVFFTGHLDDVRDFFSAIDLFIMASDSESYGLVTIEALLSGVPVLGTNSGGTPELLKYGEFGILYEPHNMKDFVSKFSLIYNNYDYFLKRAKIIEEIAEKEYSNTLEREKILEIIKELK